MYWADRPARFASAFFVIAGSAWALLSGQPGPAWLEVVWFGTVAAFGIRFAGVANQVTLSRAYLAAPALVYAMKPPDFGLLAITVALAGLTDLVDGTIARRTHAVSRLGGALDPVVDGIFIGAMGLGLTIAGAIPVWLALVAFARYLLPGLAGGVLLLQHRQVDFRHTLTGQISTTLILVLIGGVALLRALGANPANLVVGAEVVIPIATLATFVHLAVALRQRPAAATGDA